MCPATADFLDLKVYRPKEPMAARDMNDRDSARSGSAKAGMNIGESSAGNGSVPKKCPGVWRQRSSSSRS